VPLNAVKEPLGHATIEMTMRYAHLAPGASSAYIALHDGAEARSAAHGSSTV
jgi:hypothetical protein